MFGSNLRIILAAVVVLGSMSFLGGNQAEAGWGHFYRPSAPVYRPAFRPVYRPAYRVAYRAAYRPLVPAPLRRVARVPRAVYRSIVPVAPVVTTPYYSGFRGVGVGFGVAPVTYYGY